MPSYGQLAALNAGLVGRNTELAAGTAELVAANDKLAGENAELLAGNAGLVGQVAVLTELVEGLQVQVAVLTRQVGRVSSNSSQPPSKDGPASTPRAKTQRGTSGRKPGGQPGRWGVGLGKVADPDRVERVEADGCGGCGGDLDGAAGQVATSVQVFDVEPVTLSVTEFQLMARVCAGCGHTSTAPPPAQVSGGPTCYGPNVVAATTLLAACDVVGIARAADLMAALLGAPVSAGFVSACVARLDDRLVAAGFEDALKEELRDAAVIGTDETPVNVAENGKHHVYTVRTVNSHTGGGPDLLWYGAADNRGHTAIDGFALLTDHAGVLVRDGYGGYTKFDAHLGGVQQCCAHLLRHLADVHGIDPATQAWTAQVARALREGAKAAAAARAANPDGAAAAGPRPPRRAPPRLRPRRRRRDLHQPLPPLAPRQTPRTGPGPTAEEEDRPGVAVHHPPRRALDQQRQRASHPRPQGRPEDQRLLEDPDHPATPLPDPLLPGHHPQPRHHNPHRHPRRPHRQHLDAPTHRLTHPRSGTTPDWLRGNDSSRRELGLMTERGIDMRLDRRLVYEVTPPE